MVTWGSGPVLSEQDDWLSAIRSTQHTDAANHSGWLGWLGYEAGCHFERMPSRFQSMNSLLHFVYGDTRDF